MSALLKYFAPQISKFAPAYHYMPSPEDIYMNNAYNMLIIQIIHQKMVDTTAEYLTNIGD